MDIFLMYAVLHIADFALQAVLRTESGAHTRPAALFADNNKKSTVLAANAPARLAGVERGMTAPQAIARCPTLALRTPHLDAATDARARIVSRGMLYRSGRTMQGTGPPLPVPGCSAVEDQFSPADLVA